VEDEIVATKQRVNEVIEHMRSRQLELCVYYLFDDIPTFTLSDGQRIAEEIGQLLIKDRRLIATGDSSFRYVGSWAC
jgi:hypothetical protein